MQYRFCAALLAAAATQVAAHPSAHPNHQHLHARDAKAAPVDWNDPANYAGVDFNDPSLYNKGNDVQAQSADKQASPPSYSPAQEQKAPAPAPKPQQKAPSYGGGSGSTAPASGSSKQGPGGGSWGDCPGTAMKHGATVYEMFGNTGGAPGTGQCGCNVQLVGDGDAESYPYTNTFVSTASSPRKIEIWNTVGCQDGSALSGKTASQPAAATFTLPAGGKQVVAFMEGSKVNWCDYTAGGVNSDDGSRKCAYGEAEFGNTLEGDGFSGYDVSHLRNAGGMCGMSIQAPGHKVSSCTQNCYNMGEEYVDDIAPVVGKGGMRLTTKISNPSVKSS